MDLKLIAASILPVLLCTAFAASQDAPTSPRPDPKLMSFIPAGQFTMGDTFNDGNSSLPACRRSELYLTSAKVNKQISVLKHLTTGRVLLAMQHIVPFAYPLVVLILDVIALLIFRQPLARFLRTFYDYAANAAPEFYKTYPFESWMGFMKNSLLIKPVNGALEITLEGREFLKYILQQGYSVFKVG